jgi:Kef-type K+ transport system membrane component KefB
MSFGSLALVMAGGLLGPILAGIPRLAIPLVVGELLAGLAIGQTGFGWVDPARPELVFLGDVGFAVLMLIAGTHLPLRTRGLPGALRAGTVATALVALLALPVAVLLRHVTPLHDTGVFAILLSTSSAAIVMPVLTDRSAGPGARALVAIAWVSIADVATVIAIPIVLASGHVGRVVLGSVLVLAACAALYLVVRVAIEHHTLARAERSSLERGWALRLRLSFVALFALAWLATEYGTSVLIAGFGIGAVIALLGEPKSIAQELIGVGEGFLVPVFFVLLGARLDVRALFSDPANLGLLAALFVATVAVHVTVALVTRIGLSTGLLASAQLGVPAAITSLGLSDGTIEPGQGAAIVAAAIASVGVAALGARRLRASA